MSAIPAFAAPGVPDIISYQGRLTDANGILLGGTGTTYYFKFSIWDSPTVGGGTRLWPTAAPTALPLTVTDGVFDVNIGDTASGYPDALTYDFQSSDAVYLQVEVSPTGSSYETLGPRPRITSSSTALNTKTLAGLPASYYLDANNLTNFDARSLATPLTGYASSSGTITASDTILSAIEKLNGNISSGGSVTSVFGRSGLVVAQAGDYTTDLVTEGSNLYYTEGRFDTAFGLKTTSNLAEGSNLYYTDARFDTRLATKTTSDIAEGSNLYYTDTRFDTRFAAKTTDDLIEGTTNKYYSDTLARAALSVAGSPLAYNPTTGVVSITQASAVTDGYLSASDWDTFNSKQSALSFGSGLTNTSGTITSNLSTGISGGQSVVGGTGAGESLTLSSTSDATKGLINFGTGSSYDEANNRWNIGTTTGLGRINLPDAGTTISDGIWFGEAALYRSAGAHMKFGSVSTVSRYLDFFVTSNIQSITASGSPSSLALTTVTTNPASITVGGTNNQVGISRNGTAAATLLVLTQANANASSNMLDINTAVGTMASFDINGALTLANSTLGGSSATSLLNLSQTWNTTGSPTAIKLNVTNTASATTSKLMDLQVGGTSQLSVATNGAVSIGSTTGAGRINLPDAGTTVADGITWGALDLAMYRSAASTLTIRGNNAARYITIAPSSAVANIIATGSGANMLNLSASGGTSTVGVGQTGGAGSPYIVQIANTSNDANPTLTVRKTGSSATGDLIQFFGSNGAQVGSIANSGYLNMTPIQVGGSATTSTIDIAQTWNTTGAPTAIKLNVTNTASGASANLMDLQVGGVSQFTVSKAGAVGINTASPLAPLQITNTGATNVTVPGFIITRTDTTNQTHLQHYFAGINYISQNMYRDVNASWFMDKTTDPGTAIIQDTRAGQGYIAFYANPAGAGTITPVEQMRVSATGNIGIGTVSSTSKVSIADTTFANSGSLAGSVLDIAQTWNTTGNPTALKLNVTNTASGASASIMDLQVGGVSKFKIDKAGNVGIGAATPGDLLTVEKNTATQSVTTFVPRITAKTNLANESVRLGFEETPTGYSYSRVYFNASTALSNLSNSGFVNQLNGTNQWFFGMSNDGQYGGTAGTSGARYMGYYDYIGSVWRYGFTGGGDMYLGTSSASYGVKLSTSGTSSFVGGAVGIGTTNPTTARLVLADTTLAGSGSLNGGVLDMTQTWNTTGTPTAIKLNVTDTASNASSLLMDLQVGGVSKFNVTKNGAIVLSSTVVAGGNISLGGTIAGSFDAQFGSNNLGAKSANSRVDVLGTYSITSGTSRGFYNYMSFAPTSGTGTYSAFDFTGTINQTGGANGITRGLYIAPTLTSAADFRAIELASINMGSGAAGQVIIVGRNSNATPGAGSINLVSNAGTNGYVWQDAAGNLRINTAAPTNANDTAGTVVGAQTSTRDTKQDISEYTDYNAALTTITSAPLHMFRYIREVQGYGSDSPLAKSHLGFIADEVDPLFMQGNVIDQVSVNGLLIGSIKALNLKMNVLPEITDESLAVKIANFLRGIAEQGLAIVDGVKTKKVETQELCVGDEGDQVCVTKDQLRGLLQGQGGTTSSTVPQTPVVDTPTEASTGDTTTTDPTTDTTGDTTGTDVPVVDTTSTDTPPGEVVSESISVDPVPSDPAPTASEATGQTSSTEN